MKTSSSTEPVQDIMVLGRQCQTQVGVVPWIRHLPHTRRRLTLHRLKTQELDRVLHSQKCSCKRGTDCVSSDLERRVVLPVTTEQHQLVHRELVLAEGPGPPLESSPRLLQPACCSYLKPFAIGKPIGAALPALWGAIWCAPESTRDGKPPSPSQEH